MGNVYWSGGAAPVKQLTTLTFGNTWAANDTYSFSIGGKSLVLTVGSTATVAEIATQFYTAFAASDKTTGLSAGYSRTSGGQQIPEFAGIVATNPSAGVVQLEGLDGIPFTFTSLATTVGTGDTSTVTGTAATGPNFLSNPANYLAGALPVSGDTLIFDQGNVDAYYGLDYFRTNSVEIDVKIYGTWRGGLGLPPTNAAGYPEYRTRYFRWQTNPSTLEILPGNDRSTDQKPVYIDMQDCPGSTVRILANRGFTDTPTIFIIGGDTTTPLNTFQVEYGHVQVEPPDTPAASGKRFAATTISIGVPAGNTGDCSVTFGDTVRLAEATSITQYSGRVLASPSLIVGGDECAILVLGGEWHCLMQNGALQNVSVRPGGTFFMSGDGSVEDVDVGGVWDMRQGNGAVTFVTTFTVNRACSVFDPGGRGVNQIKLAPTCSIQDLTALQTGPGLTWTAA